MAKKLTDDMFEDMLELIIEGKQYRAIAGEYDCSISTLYAFLNKDEHSARTKAAMEVSANMYADKAESVLRDAEGTKEEIARARELAQHFRWMAGKRNPRAFGDKVDVTSAGEKMQAPVIQIIKPE